MNSSISFFAVVALASALCGCSGGGEGGSDSGTTLPVAGTVQPGAGTVPAGAPATYRIIDNEDMSPGLKGVDTNNNGIRDDIDRLIAKKYSVTPAMTKAAEQKARTLQKALEVTTKVQARVVGNEIRRAGRCAFKVLPRGSSENIKFREQLSHEIEALTANTKERFTAYWKGNELAGGMVFAQPAEPVCD